MQSQRQSPIHFLIAPIIGTTAVGSGITARNCTGFLLRILRHREKQRSDCSNASPLVGLNPRTRPYIVCVWIGRGRYPCQPRHLPRLPAPWWNQKQQKYFSPPPETWNGIVTFLKILALGYSSVAQLMKCSWRRFVYVTCASSTTLSHWPGERGLGGPGADGIGTAVFQRWGCLFPGLAN